MERIDIETLENLKSKINCVINDGDIKNDYGCFYLETNKEELKAMSALIDKELFKAPINEGKPSIKVKFIRECPTYWSFIMMIFAVTAGRLLAGMIMRKGWLYTDD